MKIPYNYVWYWHKVLSKFILRSFCIEVELLGREKLPSLPYILVSNHYSNFDPMVYFSIFPYPIYFIAKKEIFDTPFIGKGVAEGGHIEINRKKPGLGFIKEAIGKLKKQEPIGIFPQGTRVQEGERGEGKEGVGMLISMAKVPVFTAYIENTGNLWGKGVVIPKAGKIRVYLGEVIPYEKLLELKKDDMEKKDYFKSISDYLIEKIYQIKDKFYKNI